MCKHFGVLGGITYGLPLMGSLGPVSAGLSLLLEGLESETLSLLLVDVLHQDTLVLEDVTLGLEVEGVVPGGESYLVICYKYYLKVMLIWYYDVESPAILLVKLWPS